MKKVTALFLAMLMCMALAVPALATGVGSGDSISSGDGVVTYTATVQEPTINVTVPSLSRAIILNPYQIRVTQAMASGDIAGDSTTSGDAKIRQNSLLSTTLYLQNKSTVPLHMSLVLKGESKSTDVTFATAKIAETEKNKKVFMFVQVGTKDDIVNGTAPAATISSLTADNYDATKTNQGVFKAGETKMTNVLDIPTPNDITVGNYVPIEIGGGCTTTPTSAWTDADKIEATITFSFQAYNNTVSGS